MTGIYSILHLLVDGVCALAMFGYFSSGEKWYLYLLLYNFCAFALQMPLGIVLDGLNMSRGQRRCSPSFGFAVFGVLLTLLGAVSHPMILGLGNALFHLGGGVGVIEEDTVKNQMGRGLGVFVAPGAIGLFLGTQLAKFGQSGISIPVAGAIMILLCVMGLIVRRRKKLDNACSKQQASSGEVSGKQETLSETKAAGSICCICGCFLVVILRSYIGMAISFSWKTTLLAGVLAVLATALGKGAGGFLAASIGWKRASVISLVLAALCYLFSQALPLGILALFFFNMTMPITLYLLVKELRNLPGFAFGILTFGLFLGFLPEYFGMEKRMDGRLLGCLGSLISLFILWLMVWKKGREYR